MAFSFAPLPLSHPDEILYDHSPFILIHKNGRIERLVGEELSSAGTDQDTGVQSKDVLISPETGLRARLYAPGTITSQKQKLAVLIYFHGGGFVIGSAFSALFQAFHNKLALEANVIILSVDFRNAPEHVYPAPQEDALAAMHWVASHAKGDGNEPLLNEYADLRRVFFGGESAGATIAHYVGMRLGLQNDLVSYEDQVKVAGIVLIHPYFWGETPIGDEVNADVRERNVLANLWRVANPSISGLDDPFVNPGFDPDLSKLGCTRVLVCVAEKDLLRDRGLYYHDVLKKSGWEGQVDILEAKGEGHAFHLFTPFRENAITLFKTLSSFINGDK
ncbi:putative carboxylesterase 12 [Artemisia annua]|uniref:Putative carboxylesterase 12 n=1 Tax=Artemisia annua TaxID=35608 RepID=A0A2U1KQ12_ARTAN|nr:putative carboxylesterase 12 [Artemisia annua]